MNKLFAHAIVSILIAAIAISLYDNQTRIFNLWLGGAGAGEMPISEIISGRDILPNIEYATTGFLIMVDPHKPDWGIFDDAERMRTHDRLHSVAIHQIAEECQEFAKSTYGKLVRIQGDLVKSTLPFSRSYNFSLVYAIDVLPEYDENGALLPEYENGRIACVAATVQTDH